MILLAIEDITLQYTTRQKLAESEAKYRKFVEDINSIIIGIDLKGAITFFNHFSEKLFGYSRDEIIGKTFIGTIIPCVDSKGQDNSRICQEIFSNPTEYYANESEGVKKDGSRIVFSWSAKAIRDASGMVIEILIDGNDITELSSAQKKLEENSLTFDALLAFIPEGIIITDANRTVKKVSRYAGELFCVPPEQLVDIDESKLPGLLKLSWPNGEMIERSEDLPHSKVSATGETYTNYEIGFRHDSGIRTLSGTAAPIRDSQGTIIGTIGSWRDITDSKLLEKQLEDERDFVTAVIQTSGALITVIDMDGKITRFNKACEELTGYSADEVIGQSVFDLFIPQEESEVVIAVAERLFAGERWVDFENHWITKSGEKRFIRWRNSNLLDDRGTPAYAVATGIDITDRQQALEALRKSEEQFRYERNLLQQIVNNLPHSFVLYNPDLKIEYTNETVLKRYGLTLEEVTGKTVPELFSREISDIYVPLLQTVRDTGKSFSGEISYNVAGKTVTNLPNIVPLFNENNEIHHLLILSLDITDRKRMETALRESEERFRVTQELSPDGFLILRPLRNDKGIVTDFLWIYENDAAARMNDTNPKEVIGKKVSEILPNHDKSPFGLAYKEVAETGEVRVVEEASYYQDTFLQPRWFRVVAVPTPSGDVAILVQNVTERKQTGDALHKRTEELEAANLDLESFSYSVSHDLRSPITVIKGFSEILMNDYGNLLDQHGKSMLDHIITATNKMDSIITDLLSLSRISKERMNCQEIDLSPIAHHVINELRLTEPQRNVMISIAPSLPAWADPGFMNITLTNLIGNAWKYTGKNSDARIDIGSITIENRNVFFIRDNGAGFDMNFADKLFKPFQRLHSENQFKGTGIGLAIVQRIIQRHGGKIWTESEPGKGAVFYFTLLTCSQ